jgi:dienelactone hydrolase
VARKWVRRSTIIFIRWHVIVVALVLVSGCATGGTAVFYRTPGSEPLTVPATLTLPEKHTGRVPAVVIVHGSGGVDGRGAYHAVALNAAGIATFEIDMWAPRGLRWSGRSPPSDPRNAARRLRRTPLPERPPSNRSGENRHHGVLVGWCPIAPHHFGMAHRAVDGGTSEVRRPRALLPGLLFLPLEVPNHVDQMTGAPVLILAGAKDDYEKPDTCPKFVGSLTPEQRAHVSLIVYPDGYHGWDASRAATFHDPAANRGQGGNIRFYPDSRIAEQSRKEAVKFFRKAFGM